MDRATFRNVTDSLTKSLITGDFTLYQSVIWLPFRTEPRGGTPYTLTTIADLEQDFDLYVQAMQLNKVTDIYREIMHVTSTGTVTGAETAKGRVVTHLLSGAMRVVDPFETEFDLRKTRIGWQITTVHSDLGHINWSRGEAFILDGRFTEERQT